MFELRGFRFMWRYFPAKYLRLGRARCYLASSLPHKVWRSSQTGIRNEQGINQKCSMQPLSRLLSGWVREDVKTDVDATIVIDPQRSSTPCCKAWIKVSLTDAMISPKIRYDWRWSNGKNVSIIDMSLSRSIFTTALRKFAIEGYRQAYICFAHWWCLLSPRQGLVMGTYFPCGSSKG